MSLRQVAESAAPITSLAAHDGVLLASVSTGQLAFLQQQSQSQSQSQQQDGGMLLKPLLDTHGGPRGLAVDPRSGEVFFADAVRKAVVKLELPLPAGSAAAAAASASASTTMPALWDALKKDGATTSPTTPSSPATDDSASSGAMLWQTNTQLRSFVDSYMDAPLKGPHGIAFDSRGEIYVSDAGAFGDTGLCSPHGSVLRTIANCQQVVPLAASGLAYPAGVACNPRTGAIFVCELATNRLLRFVSRTPAGQQQLSQQQQKQSEGGGAAAAISATFGSVFHQFSGGMGPIAVAVDAEADILYVAKFDFASANPPSAAASSENADQQQQQQQQYEHPAGVGEVVVLYGTTGEEAGRISVPGTEITGLAVDSVSGQLFIAEGRNLYAVPLSH